jgi:hypothetical protein
VDVILYLSHSAAVIPICSTVIIFLLNIAFRLDKYDFRI